MHHDIFFNLQQQNASHTQRNFLTLEVSEHLELIIIIMVQGH